MHECRRESAHRWGVLRASLLAIVLAAPSAHALELQGGLGATAYGSSWRGDFGGGGLMTLGVRFARVVALDFVGWESYATVDKRINTGITFGVTGYLPLAKANPLARLFVIHQHEEALVSVEKSPLGVALGIGAGIRHRVGAGLSLGAQIPIATKDKVVWSITPRATAIYLPDVLGPKAYIGVDANFAFDLTL